VRDCSLSVRLPVCLCASLCACVYACLPGVIWLVLCGFLVGFYKISFCQSAGVVCIMSAGCFVTTGYCVPTHINA